MTKPKRVIRASKGGRQTGVSARLTEDEKRELDAVLDADRISLADWIMEQVKRSRNNREDE